MPLQIYLVSLGCPKNRVDSEVVCGLMTKAGFSLCNQPKDADLIVVNTCSFIQSATEESINTILELAEMKKAARCKRLIVIGCLAQRFKGDLKNELPEVDLFLGTDEFYKIADAVEQLDKGKDFQPSFDVPKYLYDETVPRINSQPFYTSYVKIAEGCSSPCTFCIIPKLRGPQRSRSLKSIVEEVKNLVRGGVKEINLVAQETTAYGADFGGKLTIVDLLKNLCIIEGLSWIRLLYGYPYNLPNGLLEIISQEQKICKYLDLPIQHINSEVLESMGRRGGAGEIKKIIDVIRTKFPKIALRTTVIVGFPGEGEKAFNELLDYLKEVKFDHLGVFGFSPEEGTPAAGFPNRVSDHIIKARVKEVMSLQKNISRQRCLKFKGQVLLVLIEGESEETNLLLQGRAQFQAPEIDGHVLINKGFANVGNIVSIKVTQTLDYDLIGEILD